MKNLLSITAFAIVLSTSALAQTSLNVSTWYTTSGEANLGTVTAPKPLENFFGLPVTLYFSGYAGATADGIPGVGGMLYGNLPTWKSGGLSIGLAGGWSQSKKLVGRPFLGFWSKS